MLKPPAFVPLRVRSIPFFLAALTAAACGSTDKTVDPPSVPGWDAAVDGPSVAGSGGSGGSGGSVGTGGALGPTDGPIAGNDGGGVAPDGSVGGEAGAPLPGTDGGVDGSMAGSPEKRYADFRGSRDALIVQRLVECFNGDPTAHGAVAPVESDVDLSLRFALITFDDKAAEACLQAIRTEACQAVAAEAHDTACGKALQGQLARGTFCRVDEDCRDPDKDFCKSGPATICNTRCLPRTIDGERCASGSECLPGSSCRPGPDGVTTLCAARMAEGEACDGDVCKAGLYCQANGPDGPDGTCSPIKTGGACAGTWQCPPFHACVLSAAGAIGTCSAGRKAGEACQVQVPDQPTISDCGFDLGCYPDVTSGQLKCSAGRKLDEACTELVPCRTGQCVAGKCTALRKQGESCSEAMSCQEDQACIEGKCASEILPSGGRCGGSEQRTCPAGTFCKPDGDGAAGAAGTCSPSRKLDESCQPGQCEPALDCVGGTCRRCS
jgi:hypothetical protein